MLLSEISQQLTMIIGQGGSCSGGIDIGEALILHWDGLILGL